MAQILHRVRVRLASWLIARAQRTPYFHLVNRDGSPYMDRFWLLRIGRAGVDDRGQPKPWIGVRVHHIRSSDDGRVFHDHPWAFLSWILRGGYFEERPYEGPLPAGAGAVPTAITGEPYSSTWHGPGALLFRRARDWHRLKLPEVLLPGGTWTLVVTLPPAQAWGFRVRGHKVGHREYFRTRGGARG